MREILSKLNWLQTGKRGRVTWWSLAVGFTIICTIAPLLMQGKSGSAIWIVGMMTFGAVLGLLNHSHAWRWGLLLSISFTIEAMVLGGVSDIIDLFGKIRFGVTLAIPAFIGNYGGAFVRKLIYHRIHLTGEPESIRYWKTAISFGVGAGILSLIASAADDVPIPAMILLLAAATSITYLKPHRLWRWVVALVPGLPMAVVLRIIVDVSRNHASHDLYPLEIGIAIIYAIIPVLAGAIMGRIIKTGSIYQPPREYPTYG